MRRARAKGGAVAARLALSLAAGAAGAAEQRTAPLSQQTARRRHYRRLIRNLVNQAIID